MATQYNINLAFDPEISLASQRISEDNLLDIAAKMRGLIQSLQASIVDGSFGIPTQITISHKPFELEKANEC